MAYINTNIKINSISLNCHIYFPTDLPNEVIGAGGRPSNNVNGVIWLLHGYTADSHDWPLLTSAFRYAADNGYIVICPDAGNSFYNDMAYGTPYHTLIGELLPKRLREIFRIPAQREKNFICGLSMGGYGALRIGLAYPEKFAAVGSFSGAMHLQDELAEARDGGRPEMKPNFISVFGPELTLREGEEIGAMLRKTAKLPSEEQPAVLICCGEQDFILPQNKALWDDISDIALAKSRFYTRTGDHRYDFWDRSLAEFMGWIQGDNYAERKAFDWTSPIEKK